MVYKRKYAYGSEQSIRHRPGLLIKRSAFGLLVGRPIASELFPRKHRADGEQRSSTKVYTRECDSEQRVLNPKRWKKQFFSIASAPCLFFKDE